MNGTLFYLMGASGSGKDSLLQGCRERLTPHHRVFIAHRFITRAAGAGGENHIHLTENEFQLRVAAGLFAMHWSSHGHLYGISKEIDHWLDIGLNVIMNGSREYLPQAMAQYPNLIPVMVNVDSELLRLRLIQRGRESASEIDQRIERHADMVKTLPENTLYIDNSHSVDNATHALMRILTDHSYPPCCH